MPRQGRRSGDAGKAEAEKGRRVCIGTDIHALFIGIISAMLWERWEVSRTSGGGEGGLAGSLQVLDGATHVQPCPSSSAAGPTQTASESSIPCSSLRPRHKKRGLWGNHGQRKRGDTHIWNSGSCLDRRLDPSDIYRILGRINTRRNRHRHHQQQQKVHPNHEE